MFHVISDSRKQQITDRLKERLVFNGVKNTQEVINIFFQELNKEVALSIDDAIKNEIKPNEEKDFDNLTPRQIRRRNGLAEVIGGPSMIMRSKNV